MTSADPTAAYLYPEGCDHEWFASDSVGHVAVFTTAGIGPMPAQVLLALSVTAAIGSFVRDLSARGRAEMVCSLPRPDDYIHFARRGVFSYDWQDVHRKAGQVDCYELMSRPGNPIHTNDFPEQFQSLLFGSAMPEVRFADSTTISAVGLVRP